MHGTGYGQWERVFLFSKSATVLLSDIARVVVLRGADFVGGPNTLCGTMK